MDAAIGAWQSQVAAHHAQSIRIQQAGGWTGEGQGAFFASLFNADPLRTDDPVLNRLYVEIPSGASVLDVGGGAGRYALPLALRGHRVTVVEPSIPMLEQLRSGMRALGIEIAIVQQTWEEAVVDPADVVLAAHVVYGVEDIAPFVRKLQAHAQARVLVPAFMESPPTLIAPLWPPVHGETRINLPALPELLAVLWALDIFPDLTMFEPTPAETEHG